MNTRVGHWSKDFLSDLIAHALPPQTGMKATINYRKQLRPVSLDQEKLLFETINSDVGAQPNPNRISTLYPMTLLCDYLISLQ